MSISEELVKMRAELERLIEMADSLADHIDEQSPQEAVDDPWTMDGAIWGVLGSLIEIAMDHGATTDQFKMDAQHARFKTVEAFAREVAENFEIEAMAVLAALKEWGRANKVWGASTNALPVTITMTVDRLLGESDVEPVPLTVPAQRAVEKRAAFEDNHVAGAGASEVDNLEMLNLLRRYLVLASKNDVGPETPLGIIRRDMREFVARMGEPADTD